MSKRLNVTEWHFGNSARARPVGGVAAVRWCLLCSIGVHLALGLLTLALRSIPPVAEPPPDTVAMMFETSAVLPLATPASSPKAGTDASQPGPMPTTAELPAAAAPMEVLEPNRTLPPPPAALPTPADVPPPEPPPPTPPTAPPTPPVPEPLPPVAAPAPPEAVRVAPEPSMPQPSPAPVARPAPRPLVPSTPKPPVHLQAQRAARPEPPPGTATRQADLPAQGPPATAQTGQQAPSSPAPSAEISPGWQKTLAAWLQSHQNYPDDARRRAEEGVALIRFHVSRDGQVLAVTLVRSSGSATLDEAAQAMVRGAHLPPFPADMPQSEITVTVPARYRLEQQGRATLDGSGC